MDIKLGTRLLASIPGGPYRSHGVIRQSIGEFFLGTLAKFQIALRTSSGLHYGRSLVIALKALSVQKGDRKCTRIRNYAGYSVPTVILASTNSSFTLVLVLTWLLDERGVMILGVSAQLREPYKMLSG